MVEAAALLDRAHAQVTETDMGYGAALAGCPGCRLGPGATTRHGLHGTTYPRDQPRGGKRIRQVDPSLRPPPRFPTKAKGADRARAGGATAPAPGRPRAERGQSTSRVACSRWQRPIGGSPPG